MAYHHVIPKTPIPFITNLEAFALIYENSMVSSECQCYGYGKWILWEGGRKGLRRAGHCTEMFQIVEHSKKRELIEGILACHFGHIKRIYFTGLSPQN